MKIRRRSIVSPPARSFLDRYFQLQTRKNFKQSQRNRFELSEETAGKSFHVRMHRRGFKGKISTVKEERMLNEAILKSLEELGTPGHLNFEDPDAILAVETLGQQAGFSIWMREELNKYPFLKLT